MAVVEELAKHAPSFIWGGLAFWTVYLFRDPIIRLFPRMSGFRAVGLEMSFAERSMEQAAAAANRNNEVVASTVTKGHVDVTRRDRERVMERAQRSAVILQDKRILWLDDLVANNRLERELLESFSLKIEQVQCNHAALAALTPASSGYALIISDIERTDPKEPNGLSFLSNYREAGGYIPVIFYVSRVDVDKPVPLGAFGITNRPDELLHLVIDVLKRRA